MLVIALALTACAKSPDEPDVATPPADGAGGLRLANGLYDMDDGTVQAIGTLEYQDLEGGFWAITGGLEGDGNVAVIANGADFAEELEALKGRTVSVTGKRLDGASIRMAGPEIEIDSVTEISDTPGAAE
jgi:hypothetical protein